MQGPKEAKKGLIGTRKVLTKKQIEEKYGLSPQAPFPEWTKKVVRMLLSMTIIGKRN